MFAFVYQVATRGAVLYFVLADLAGIDVMYQFSLSWFRNMFTLQICGENGRLETPVPPSAPRSTAGLVKSAQSGRVSRATPRPETPQEPAMTDEELNQHMQLMIDR